MSFLRPRLRLRTAQVPARSLLVQGATWGQVMILILLALGGILNRAYHFDPVPLIPLLCWAVVAVSLYAFWAWRRAGGSYFDPYSLFLLAAVLFNASLALLYVLGLDNNGILDSTASAEVTAGALYLVATGLAGMNLGALLAVPREGWPRIQRPATCLATTQALRRTGWILFAVSILPTVILTERAVEVVFQSGYFALYQQPAGVGIAAGPQILTEFLVPALLCLLASSHSPAYRRFVISTALVYSGVQFVLGARFEATAPLIALGWLWDRSVRPFSRRTMLLLALLAIFLMFPLTRVTRNTALVERSLDLNQELASSIQDYGVSAIAEFGGTIKTIIYTVDLVPATRDFDKGLQYLYALSTVVPNVFGGVHPAVARGTPSSWLVWAVDPYTAAAGGGLGFSFIAEAYLNFGYWGTPLVLLLFGFLYVRFILWAVRSSDVAKMTVLASFLSSLLVYARGDSIAVARPLVWYSLVVYVLFLSLRKEKRFV